MKRIGCGMLFASLLLIMLNFVAPTPIDAQAAPAFERHVLGVALSGKSTIVADRAGSQNALGVLEPGEPLIAVGRSGDYLRVRFRDGIGYIRVDAVKLDGELSRLAEVTGDMPADPLPAADPVADAGRFPIVPTIPGYTGAIFQRGKALGERSTIFSKVGDCMSTETPLYLGPFADGKFDFGPYANLRGVYDFYSKEAAYSGYANSFGWESVAARNGYNASSVLDPDWLSSRLCKRGTSPLDCEYNLVKPAVAVIMFGTNDITSLSAAQYDFFLRVVVHKTIARGIIPLLSTFPGHFTLASRANLLNQIIYEIGRDYQVPVMNLWLALQPLPNKGLDPVNSYLSLGGSRKVTYFSEGNLKFGYTMRNLVTMQSLDVLWRSVIG